MYYLCIYVYTVYIYKYICIYDWLPSPTFFEVFLINNLVFGLPKPYFMVLGASWFIQLPIGSPPGTFSPINAPTRKNWKTLHDWCLGLLDPPKSACFGTSQGGPYQL